MTVEYVVNGGTATAGVDFIASQGTLSFSPGTTTRTITVPVIGDRLNEGNETVFVNMSYAVNATIGDPQGVGTIVDDDLPGLAVSDAVIAEPHTGTANATFTVSLLPPAAGTTTVDFGTADGSANASGDYVAKVGTLTFPAGQTSQTLSVPVKADAVPEVAETFFVDLSGSSGPAIARSRGTATIYEAGFYPVSPCRVLDTRVDGQGPSLSAGSTRTVIAVAARRSVGCNRRFPEPDGGFADRARRPACLPGEGRTSAGLGDQLCRGPDPRQQRGRRFERGRNAAGPLRAGRGRS